MDQAEIVCISYMILIKVCNGMREALQIQEKTGAKIETPLGIMIGAWVDRGSNHDASVNPNATLLACRTSLASRPLPSTDIKMLCKLAAFAAAALHSWGTAWKPFEASWEMTCVVMLGSIIKLDSSPQQPCHKQITITLGSCVAASHI